jgi:cell division protein FtsW
VGPFHFLTRHLMFLVGGACWHWWIGAHRAGMAVQAAASCCCWCCFVLLLLVFLPGIGKTVNGARRWINLGLSSFQAVEAVKLFLIVWLASYLVRHQRRRAAFSLDGA